MGQKLFSCCCCPKDEVPQIQNQARDVNCCDDDFNCENSNCSCFKIIIVTSQPLQQKSAKTVDEPKSVQSATAGHVIIQQD